MCLAGLLSSSLIANRKADKLVLKDTEDNAIGLTLAVVHEKLHGKFARRRINSQREPGQRGKPS